MIFGDRKIEWIEGTPVGISVYSVKNTSTIMLDDMLEIIYCLKGSVSFSYSYDNVCMTEGEFISVDKDAYYLYDGIDNVCISLYFDLKKFTDKYPYIMSLLFLCEGHKKNQEKRDYYRQIKGKIITLLKYISENRIPDANYVNKIADDIIELFINRFDILFYDYNDFSIFTEEVLSTYRNMNSFINENITEKLTVKDMADRFNFTYGHVSEFLRKVSVGFRNMVSYRRVVLSERYLLTTDDTIMQISENCGFSDAQYYYSAFKKWCRCTPKEFREKYKENDKENSVRYMDISEIKEQIDDALVEHYIDMFS